MENLSKNRVFYRLKPALSALVFVLFLGQTAWAQTPTLQSATALIDRGQPEKALKEIAQLLGADPRNEKLYYQQGRAYFDLEDLSNARTSFSRGAELGQRFPWNFVGLGAVAASEGNFDQTKANLSKAKELNTSNDVNLLIAIADAWMHSSKKEFLSEAEVILYEVTIKDQTNARAYIGLGDLYDRRNVPELALQNYEKAISIDPKFIFGHLRVGQLKKKGKDYKGAAEAFQKAIEVDPTYAPSYREMAEMYNLAGRYDDALLNMEKYLEMMGGDVSARVKYGIFLYYAKQYQKSIDECNRVFQDTTPIVLYRIMGYDYLELSQPDSCLKYMDKFMSTAKASYINADDYLTYAKAYEAKKDYAQGISYYEKAIQRAAEQESPRPELANNIADLYNKQGNYKAQIATLEKYLSGRTPKLKEYFSLGRAYYSDSNWVRSDSVFQKMTEAKPELHFPYMWRGRCNAQIDTNGALGTAKPHYEKVIELLSKSEDEKVKNKNDFIEANDYLVSYYLLMNNDNEKALPYLMTVLSMDPKHHKCNEIYSFYYESKKPGAVQCSGKQSNGDPCKRRTTDASGKCPAHR